MTLKQKTDIETMGQTMTAQIHFQVIYTIEGKELGKQDRIQSTVTLDTLAFSIEGFPEEIGLDTKPLRGLCFGLTFTSLGEELEFTGIDSLPKIDLSRMGGGKQDISSFMRHLLPDLPFKSVKIGDPWMGTGQYTKTQQGMDMTVKTEATNIAEASENLNGWECLRINTRSTGTLDGSGKRMGMDVVFEGDMENSLTWHFAHEEGILVRIISEQLMEGTIMVTGQVDMAAPMVQETRVETELIEVSEKQ